MQIGNSMQHSLDTASSRTNRSLALQPPCEHAFTSVIVCTLGSRPSLEQCLASLVAQNCSRCEILVVLNGAHNDEFAQRLVWYPVRVLSETKRGISAARNRAVLSAEGSLLCFVDDDVIADPDWLHQLISGFQDSLVACVTGRVRLEGSFLPNEVVKESYNSIRALSAWTLDNSEPNWFAKVLGPDVGFGCNLAFRKSFFENCVRFPDALGAGAVVAATDEAFMFFEVLRHGLRINHCPSATVTHVYDNDLKKQKKRTKEVCSAIVALHLKFLFEESGFRIKTLKVLIAAGKRRLGRVLRGHGVFRNRKDILSFFERFGAELRGIGLYCRYLLLRNTAGTMPCKDSYAIAQPCEQPDCQPPD